MADIVERMFRMNLLKSSSAIYMKSSLPPWQLSINYIGRKEKGAIVITQYK